MVDIHAPTSEGDRVFGTEIGKRRTTNKCVGVGMWLGTLRFREALGKVFMQCVRITCTSDKVDDAIARKMEMKGSQ